MTLSPHHARVWKHSVHVRSAGGRANEYEYDRFAVAIVNDGEVSRTLRYDGNFVFCEVTGESWMVEFNLE